MTYNRAYVTTLQAQGKRVKFLLFWGHTEPGPEATRACLSQWYPSPFTLEGTRYHCAEQYMMAQKARLFGDEEVFQEIMAARHPKQCKALGQRVRGFSEEIWAVHRVPIVMEGNLAKFSQNDRLKAFLCQTGRRVLAEASPYDRIWGIGLAADDPAAESASRWRGENLLGFTLMKVRDLLAADGKRICD